MAEVKRVNGTSALPLKKPPSFSHSSSTYKHIYDDVFASPLQSRQQFSSFVNDDYAEMFGSTRSNNGTWNISYSSIPVLDLPPPSEMRVRSESGVTTVSGERGGGEVDYGGVFSGIGNGSFGLPDGEELFDQLHKKAKTSSNTISRSEGQTRGTNRSEILRQSQNGQSLNNVSNDSLQDFEWMKNEVAMKRSGEMKKAALAHDFSGDTCKKVEAVSAQTTWSRKPSVIKDGTQLGKDDDLANKLGKHSRHTSSDLGNVQNGKSGEMKKATPAHDFSGDTCKEVEGVSAQTTWSRKTSVIKEGTQLAKDDNLANKLGKHSRHTSSDLGNVQNGKSGLKASGFMASNSVDTSYEISQSALGVTNSFAQPSDSTKPFDHNKMLKIGTSEAICAANIHAIHESASTLYEIDTTPDNLSSETPVLKDDTETTMADISAIHESTSTLHESVPTQNNMSSETDVLKDDTETEMDGNPAEKQEKHSRNSSSELGAGKLKSDLHAGFESESRLSESFSHEASQDACRPSPEVGFSKMIGDDIAVSFDVRRKKGRHSRITSLDLGDRKHSHEQDGHLKRKPRFGGSYSFDASHDPCAARVKVQPSMMAPSSSVPQFFPVESHYKISENSSWRNFGTNVYRDAVDSPPSLDNQLDMNSAAAISATALQRALEEAAMTFQLAKEYLEREGKGSSKMRFKDTLKVKKAPDEQLADEVDQYQQTMMHDNWINRPAADTEEQKLPFLKGNLEVKLANDNQFADEVNRCQKTTIHETCPHADSEKERLVLSERTSALENCQPSPASEHPEKVLMDEPVFEDQKSVQDEGRIKEKMMHENFPPVHSETDRISVSEITSSVEDGQPSPTPEEPKKFVTDDPIFQNRKKFVKDERCIEERNPNMSKVIDGRDRQEGGGEWEAAKHLNQLICGVKNKIASFMTWQTDTEKKEDIKETEPGIRSELQSEEAEPDLIGVENAEMNAAEKNQDATGYHGEHVEIEIGFLSEPVEPYENESFWTDKAGQEKAENSVDLSPGVSSSAAQNIMFFPFRHESECPTDTEEEGNEGSQKCIETEFMSVREQVLNEMKYEQLQAKDEDDIYPTKDSVGKGDLRRHVYSIIEETNEIVEEPYSLAGKEGNEHTNEGDTHTSLDNECPEEPIRGSHYPESITERDGNCEGHEAMKETENWQHDAEVLKETYLEGEIVNEGIHGCQEYERDPSLANHIQAAAGQMDECNEFITDVPPIEHIGKIGEEVSGIPSCTEVDKDVFVQTESSYIEVNMQEVAEDTTETVAEDTTETVAEEACSTPAAENENPEAEIDHIQDTTEQLTQQTTCVPAFEDDYQQTENACLSDAEETCTNDDSIDRVEEGVGFYEKCDRMMEIPNPSLGPKLNREETVLFYDSPFELDDITEDVDANKTLPFENFVLYSSQSSIPAAEVETTCTENEHIEDAIEQVVQQATCFATFEDDCQQTENVCLSETEEPYSDDGIARVADAKFSYEKCDMVKKIPNPSLEPKLKEESVLFYDSSLELDETVEDLDVNKTFEFEKFVMHHSQSDVYPGKEEADVKTIESESRDILENQIKHELEEARNVGEVSTINGQEVENCGVEAVQRRRRWFDNGKNAGPSKRPSILEGDVTEVETDQETLDESVLAGSVEIHADELHSERQEVFSSKDADPAVNHNSGGKGSESTPKRRRWFVKRGEEGLPVPPPLFQGININLDDPHKFVNETLLHSKSDSSLDKLNAEFGESLNSTDTDVAINGGKDKKSVEAAPRRRRWFESGANVEPAVQLRNNEDAGITPAMDQESNVNESIEDDKLDSTPTTQETEVEPSKVEPVNDRHLDEVNRKEKEREKERIAVERAIREARERAFAEARERAKRDALERPNAEARQRVAAGAHERVGKVPTESRTSSEKAAMDAKLRAERAAVERATSEARERAMQKALSEKASHRSREQDPSFQSSSSFSRVDSSNKGEKYDGVDNESAERRKARLERQSRTTERAANALEEKNRRDLLAQKEEAAKNMMGVTLDAEVKRWSSGKEGNLRVLLSTLQYILGPDSGWQTVSLTDLIAATAVRKAYKKATLCVHPDKLQQRGANLQQKYICDKVFDLLKDAWSKFNPDER